MTSEWSVSVSGRCCWWFEPKHFFFESDISIEIRSSRPVHLLRSKISPNNYAAFHRPPNGLLFSAQWIYNRMPCSTQHTCTNRIRADWAFSSRAAAFSINSPHTLRASQCHTQTHRRSNRSTNFRTKTIEALHVNAIQLLCAQAITRTKTKSIYKCFVLYFVRILYHTHIHWTHTRKWRYVRNIYIFFPARKIA